MTLQAKWTLTSLRTWKRLLTPKIFVGCGFALAVSLATSTGCAIFGANLPLGTAGGSFVDEPRTTPAFSPEMQRHREDLEKITQQETSGHLSTLRHLFQSSKSFREQLGRREQFVQEAYEIQGEVSQVSAELVLEAAHWFLELDNLLYRIWLTYRDHLPYASEPDPYAPTQAANLSSFTTRLKGGLVALCAEVVRMDNTHFVIETLGDEFTLVQFLNRGDASRGIPAESFDRALGAFRDPDHRRLLQQHLRAVMGEDPRVEEAARTDPQVAFLLSLLRDSVQAQVLVDEGPILRQALFYGALAQRSSIMLLTPLFDAIIATAFRGGALLNSDALPRIAAVPNVAGNFFDSLAPLDVIIVQDARFGFDSGAYSSAVIYLGDYRWLIERGLAEHPAFSLHSNPLRRGQVFLRVTDRGASLVDLDDLALAQDVVVLRYLADAQAEPPAENTEGSQDGDQQDRHRDFSRFDHLHDTKHNTRSDRTSEPDAANEGQGGSTANGEITSDKEDAPKNDGPANDGPVKDNPDEAGKSSSDGVEANDVEGERDAASHKHEDEPLGFHTETDEITHSEGGKHPDNKSEGTKAPQPGLEGPSIPSTMKNAHSPRRYPNRRANNAVDQDLETRELVRRALDILVDPVFVNPKPGQASTRAAKMLQQVYGLQRLQTVPAAGEQQLRLGHVVARATRTSAASVIFVTKDANQVPREKARTVVEEHLKLLD